MSKKGLTKPIRTNREVAMAIASDLHEALPTLSLDGRYEGLDRFAAKLARAARRRRRVSADDGRLDLQIWTITKEEAIAALRYLDDRLKDERAHADWPASSAESLLEMWRDLLFSGFAPRGRRKRGVGDAHQLVARAHGANGRLSWKGQLPHWQIVTSARRADAQLAELERLAKLDPAQTALIERLLGPPVAEEILRAFPEDPDVIELLRHEHGREALERAAGARAARQLIAELADRLKVVGAEIYQK